MLENQLLTDEVVYDEHGLLYDRMNMSALDRDAPVRPAWGSPELEDKALLMWPFPLAAAYHEVLAKAHPRDQYAQVHRLVEQLFRFFALVNLANAAACGEITNKELGGWLDKLASPTMGRTLGLIRSTTQHLAKQDALFVGELEELFVPGSAYDEASEALSEMPNPWDTAAGELVNRRNVWAHKDLVVDDERARHLLREISPSLGRVFGGSWFLADYLLGRMEPMGRVGDHHQYCWYGAQGFLERSRPRDIFLENPPQKDPGFLLLHPASSRALHLAPFFRWGMTATDDGVHLTWSGLNADQDPIRWVCTTCMATSGSGAGTGMVPT